MVDSERQTPTCGYGGRTETELPHHTDQLYSSNAPRFGSQDVCGSCGGFVYVIKTWSGWVTSSLGVLAPVDELHCLRSCAAAGGGRLPTGVREDRLEEIEGAEAEVVRRHRAIGLDEDQQR